jgi:PncC family amidohydrolase
MEKRLTVTTAESCTGGRVAAALTSVPGVSASFMQGFVTYSNEAKSKLLGVDPKVIEQHGAVSEPCARAMAAGARAAADTDLAVAITGIAGPDGGTPAKPVGLVHFAVARRDGTVTHLERKIPGDREQVQVRSTAAALDLLRLAALG